MAKYICIDVSTKSVSRVFITKLVSPAPFIAEENIILDDSKSVNTAINLKRIITVGFICSITKDSEPFEKGYISIFGIKIYTKTIGMIYAHTI
jgi:hypothetical protein